MFNWNDIRVFLAVAEEGSTLAAARVVGLDQTKVARRMDALCDDVRRTIDAR